MAAPRRSPRILVMHEVAPYPHVLYPLREAGEVVVEPPDQRRLAANLGQYDAYVASLAVRVNDEALGNAGRLRVIATSSTGTDHIEMDRCRQIGIEVISLKDDIEFLRGITCTAELAFGLLLAVARNLPWAFDAAKQGFWGRDAFRGHQISGKTLGVLGVGRLGTMMARYGLAFRMRVLGCDVRKIEEPGVEQVDMETLLRESDYLSVHVHLDDSTRGMLGKREFAAMKDGAVLVNTSRGAVLDEDALLNALVSGKLGGAGCDVICGEWDANLSDHPLVRYARTHQNLIIVPHIGGVTFESQEAAMSRTCAKLAAWLAAHSPSSAP